MCTSDNRAQIHPEIQARVPQVFIMKCLNLLKDQERKLSQKFCRVYGIEESSISTEDEDRDRVMSSIHLHPGLPSKQLRFSNSRNTFTQEEFYTGSTEIKPSFHKESNSNSPAPGYQPRDKSSSLDEESTTSSALLVDRRLKDIEANFKLATSIYDDISDLHNNQSPYLDRIQQSLDQALKKTTATEIETGEHYSQLNKDNSGLCWKIMLVLLLCGVMAALCVRSIRG